MLQVLEKRLADDYDDHEPEENEDEKIAAFHNPLS